MSITIEVDEELLREAEAATGIGAREELVSLALKKLAATGPCETDIPLHPQLYEAWEAARTLPPLSDADAEEMERHLLETGTLSPPWSA